MDYIEHFIDDPIAALNRTIAVLSVIAGSAVIIALFSLI